MSFGKGHHLHLIDGSAYIFRAYHALPETSQLEVKAPDASETPADAVASRPARRSVYRRGIPVAKDGALVAA